MRRLVHDQCSRQTEGCRACICRVVFCMPLDAVRRAGRFMSATKLEERRTNRESLSEETCSDSEADPWTLSELLLGIPNRQDRKVIGPLTVLLRVDGYDVSLQLLPAFCLTSACISLVLRWLIDCLIKIVAIAGTTSTASRWPSAVEGLVVCTTATTTATSSCYSRVKLSAFVGVHGGRAEMHRSSYRS